MSFQRRFAALLAAACALAASANARADEPRSATEPRVMMEAGEVTSVIDAFDDGDPFDLNVTLGFEWFTKSAKILRETHIYGPGLSSGGYTSNLENVAEYTETQSRLIPRLDVGIYKDLALYFKVPIILSNTRELADLDGSASHQGVVLGGAPGEQLFALPFTSPDRSGIEHIAVGLDLDILNQARDPTKPTWLFGVEGRFSVGEPMHACTTNPKPGQVDCANPADVNRNGQKDVVRNNVDLEGEDAGKRDPGVTRGTIALEGHTLMSKRIKYIEPYGGFSALFEFQQDSSDYGISDLEGSLVNHPPLVGTMIFGLMVIPWENREKYGRLTFDLRFTGSYKSEGRDYSELFDALGSSDAPTLRNPQWAKFTQNPDFDPDRCSDSPDANTDCRPFSIIDLNSQKSYFSGLTDVQAHGSYRVSGSATWQASEYVKFTFGLGFRHDQAHGITADQPCNPDFKDNAGQAGPCKVGDEEQGQIPGATGIPNPNYRPTINAVGRRFYVDASNTVDIFASGTVMF